MFFNHLVSPRFYHSTIQQVQVAAPFINSKIKAFVQQGLYSEALLLYSQKPNSPLSTTSFTFPSLLKACASLSSLCYGKSIHSTIITMGLQFDPYIITSLINMYVKCGSLSNAVQVFVQTSQLEILAQDITLWNSLIDGHFRLGHVEEGLVQFRRMQFLGVRPDAYSLSILLRNGVFGPMEGKQIHAYIIRRMFDRDPFLETALIDMYSSCCRIMDASRVFDKLEEKNNSVAWNAMMGGFCVNGLWQNSLELFCLMKKGNCHLVSTSFTAALTACSQGEEDACFGNQVHCDVIKLGFERDPYVCTSLVTMYAKSRLVEDAKKVFDQTPDKEIELWNAMIAAYVGNGYAYDALEAYSWMRVSGIPSDSFTIVHILSSSSLIESGDFGRTVHGELIKRPMQSNIAIQSALLTMYSKFGSTVDACSVFKTMKEKDMVAWGSMISGFCQNRNFKEALELFKAMKADGVVPDSDIIASVISGCMGLEDKELGCEIHGLVIKSGLESDVFVATSLVDMYSKCGFPEMAENIFSGMPHKNLVAWNSLIYCYNWNGLPDLAVYFFSQIVLHGMCPDSVSITCVLAAVSSIAALLKGKTIHGYHIRLEIPSDIQVKNGLIDLYIKCGCLKYAEHIFQSMSQRNLVTWNSMIDGYGSHGECPKAISLLEDMKRSGIAPDNVTLLSLISSCSHSGLVEEGLTLFQSMREEYGIEPRMEHYVNIVDLLGRAGRMDDAYSFITNMPIEPDRSIWLCLLCACRVHRNMELGELAANNLLKMEPTRGSNYVQLLNLYGDAELWDRAAKLRASMKEMGIKKRAGCSWIEVGSRVDVFFSSDSSLPRTAEIFKTLTCLRKNMQVKEDYHQSVAEAYWESM